MQKENRLKVTCQGAATADISDLAPFQGELKSLTKDNFNKLKKSILKYGITFPFFVWKQKGALFTLDGHQRDRVLKKMRDDESYVIPKLPVDFVEARDEKEAKEKILLLSSQYGKMTEETLHDFIMEGELDFPDLKEFLDLPQINLDHFDKGWMTDDGQLIEDEAPEPSAEAITKAGDLYELDGKHRILCGDSTESEQLNRLMNGCQADAILTDPIYGQNQEGVPNDAPQMMEQIVPSVILSLPCENAIAVLFQSPRTFPVALDALRTSQWKMERMLWLYKKAQCVKPWRGWLLKSEAILIASKGDGHWNEVNPYQHDCYEVSEVSGELAENLSWHGSVKPLAVVQDLCGRITREDDLVYDPFLGSGTTLIAAQQLGRRCYGIEIEPRYVDVCIQRYLNLRPDAKILRNGEGIDWPALVAERDRKIAEKAASASRPTA